MSYDIIKESIPQFVRRVNDHVFEGSNNVITIMGTDRPSGLDSGYGHINGPDGGKKAGSWHVITGRSEESPSLDTDDSYIYMSMRTDIDKNTKLESIEFNTGNTSGIIFKSDAIRIIGRKDLKIVVGNTHITMDGSKIVIDGPNIELGSGATERVVKGDVFMSLINKHAHPTPSGPSGKMFVPMTAAQHLSSRKVTVK